MDRYLETKDGRVYYDLINPEKKETIVFLHGVAINGHMWDPQVHALQKDYAIINIDLRGHGRSFPTRCFGIREAARDVYDILKREGREAFLLVGLSLGGYVVQSFVYRYGGANGYVVADTSPASRDFYLPYELESFEFFQKFIELMPEAFVDWLFTISSTVYLTNAHRMYQLADCEAKSCTRTYFAQMGFAFAKDREIIFDAPLLAMCGVHDMMGTVGLHMQDWLRMGEDVKLAWIPLAGHASNMDNPVCFNMHLRDFAKKCFKETAPELALSA